VPLEPVVALTGRRGTSETLFRQRVEVEGPGEVIVEAVAAPVS